MKKTTLRLRLTPPLDYAGVDAALAMIEAGVRRLRAVIRARVSRPKAFTSSAPRRSPEGGRLDRAAADR